MPLDTSELDATLAAAVANLRALRDAAANTPGAEGLLERFAALQRLGEPGQRAVEASLLQPISTGWRGYDDAPPQLQAMMDCYSAAVIRLREAAIAALLADDGAWLVAHARDTAVQRALREHAAVIPAAVRHRTLLAHSRRNEHQLGDRQLLFLIDGALVVVDGRGCYGPVKPDIIAVVGQRGDAGGPRYVVLRDFRDQPRALDLEQLRYTEFQRQGVVRHQPTLDSFDEAGVVLGLGRSMHRFGWHELQWTPLRAFDV